MTETREQQDRRLAHADSLPKELVELETEFTDWWLKDHDFTPTFADAIGWARDKQRAELTDKACEWLEKYMESLGYIDEWCRKGEDAFRKDITNYGEIATNKPEYDAEYLQSKIDAFSDARRKDGKTADEMLDDCRGGALELTWQDVQKIVEIADAMIDKDVAGELEHLATPEAYYTEILKRFKEIKED